MFGGKALVWPGVQDLRPRNKVVGDPPDGPPRAAVALAAAPERPHPEFGDVMAERAERPAVERDGVIAEEASDHLPQPCPLLGDIEKGAGEFKLPWHRPAESLERPVNIQSGKAYRGINVVTLWVEAQLKSYATPVWGTYKQFQEKGCQVRKQGSLLPA